MPIQLNEEDGGKLLNVHVSGKLTSADYEHFVPEFERLVSQHGKPTTLTKENSMLNNRAASAHILGYPVVT